MSVGRTAHLLLAGVMALAGLVRGGDAQAQAADSSAAGAPGAASDSIQLVFEREVFTYPSFERRNPFRALTGEEDIGPRFEDMVLLGVVLSPQAETSIAVLGARPPGSGVDEPATRLFRLRSGEIVGNVRVIEIRPREVVFAVEDFGIVETRMLTMPRTGPIPPGPPPEAVPPDATPPDGPDAPPDGADAPLDGADGVGAETAMGSARPLPIQLDDTNRAGSTRTSVGVNANGDPS